MKKITKKYTFAVIAIDVVVFTVQKDELKVLLIKMKKEPFMNMWAAPGGLVKATESIDEAAERILKEKGGIKNVYLEQLYAFGDVDRDPYGRVVSIAYFALISSEGIKPQTSKEYQDITWFGVKELPQLAYDHKEVIDHAVRKLQEKIGQTNIVYTLLPKEFTLTELQKMYELILGKKLDKRNFRKKILSLGLVAKSKKKKLGEANRPAVMFRFIKKVPQMINIL